MQVGLLCVRGLSHSMYDARAEDICYARAPSAFQTQLSQQRVVMVRHVFAAAVLLLLWPSGLQAAGEPAAPPAPPGELRIVVAGQGGLLKDIGQLNPHAYRCVWGASWFTAATVSEISNVCWCALTTDPTSSSPTTGCMRLGV